MLLLVVIFCSKEVEKRRKERRKKRTKTKQEEKMNKKANNGFSKTSPLLYSASRGRLVVCFLFNPAARIVTYDILSALVVD